MRFAVKSIVNWRYMRYNVEKEGDDPMLNISKEWYKKVFEQHIISEYGTLDVLKQYDVIRFGKIQDHMLKEVMRNYNLKDNEITTVITKNRQLCSECINKYRI